jgi:UDP-N-acetylmuramoyl-tripeptide--D-alanyl-D-alanine ligase
MAPVEIPVSRVVDACDGAFARGDRDAVFSSVSSDSRALSPGALFVAVPGERFDGHDFIAGAVAAGARGVLIARGRSLAVPAGVTIVEVDDTVAALGQLARAHRLALRELRVVAITGSNGKTTTKDMLAAILTSAVGGDAVLKTEGNLNNHLGVPLTLLRLTSAHRFAVVEMGMSGLGEIAYLTELARPDVAVIVSIAGVHLEQLRTIENVAKAKAEIFAGLGPLGVAVYPAHEPLLRPYTAALAHAITFGPEGAGAAIGYDDVRPGPTGVSLRLHLAGVTSKAGAAAHVPLIGRHHASNAAAAAAAARALDVGEGSILDGLARVQPGKHRGQLLQLGGRTVFDDCYNAAPPSMRAALDALVELTPPGRRRLAVLGDMLELGPESPSLHAAIGAYAAERVDELITIGKLAAHAHEAARPRLGPHALHAADDAAAAARVREASGAGDVILVKASRGMKLERVIDELARAWPAREGA